MLDSVGCHNSMANILNSVSSVLSFERVELWVNESNNVKCLFNQSHGQVLFNFQTCKLSPLLCELVEFSTKQFYWEDINETTARDIYEDIELHVNSVVVYRLENQHNNSFKLFLVGFSETVNHVDENKLSFLAHVNNTLSALLECSYDDGEDICCGESDDFELDVTHHEPTSRRSNHGPHYRVMYSIPEEDDDDGDCDTDDNSSDADDDDICYQSSDELDEKNYTPQQCTKKEFFKGPLLFEKPTFEQPSSSDSFESYDSSCLTPREVFDCDKYTNVVDNETNSTIHLHEQVVVLGKTHHHINNNNNSLFMLPSRCSCA